MILEQEEARIALLAAAQRLESSGLNRGSTGNLSLRVGDELLVTPSGVPASDLTPAAMVVLGWDGKKRDPEQPEKATSEWRIHRDILTTRPELGAVVHCHSPQATTLACLGRSIPAFHYMVAVAGGTDIRCAPYAVFGSQALSDHALAALEGRRACLLANHGMIACGATLERALALAVEVESLAEIYCRCLQLGEPRLLTIGEMAEVLERFRDYGQAGGQDKEET